MRMKAYISWFPGKGDLHCDKGLCLNRQVLQSFQKTFVGAKKTGNPLQPICLTSIYFFRCEKWKCICFTETMTYFFVLLHLFFSTLCFFHSLLNELGLGFFLGVFFVFVFCLLVACFFIGFLFFPEYHFVHPIFASSKRVGQGALSKTSDGEGYISSLALHCCVEDSHLPVPVVPDVSKVKAGLDKGSGGWADFLPLNHVRSDEGFTPSVTCSSSQ